MSRLVATWLCRALALATLAAGLHASEQVKEDAFDGFVQSLLTCKVSARDSGERLACITAQVSRLEHCPRENLGCGRFAQFLRARARPARSRDHLVVTLVACRRFSRCLLLSCERSEAILEGSLNEQRMSAFLRAMCSWMAGCDSLSLCWPISTRYSSSPGITLASSGKWGL